MVFGNINHGCIQNSETFTNQDHIIQNSLNASLENINNSFIQSFFTDQAHIYAYSTFNATIQTLQSILFNNLNLLDFIYQSDRSNFNTEGRLLLFLADLEYTKDFWNSDKRLYDGDRISSFKTQIMCFSHLLLAPETSSSIYFVKTLADTPVDLLDLFHRIYCTTSLLHLL